MVILTWVFGRHFLKNEPITLKVSLSLEKKQRRLCVANDKL